MASKLMGGCQQQRRTSAPWRRCHRCCYWWMPAPAAAATGAACSSARQMMSQNEPAGGGGSGGGDGPCRRSARRHAHDTHKPFSISTATRGAPALRAGRSVGLPSLCAGLRLWFIRHDTWAATGR